MIKQILLVSFVGAILEVDFMTFGQFMISRPVVSGSIIGWILGDFKTGLIIGTFLELIWISIIPMGAAIPPDALVVCVIATAITILSGKNIFPVFSSWASFIIALTIPFGLLFKKLDIIHRELNINLVHYAEKEILKGKFYSVDFVNYFGILCVFFKAFIFFFFITAAGVIIFPKLYSIIPEGAIEGLSLFYIFLPLFGLGIVFNHFLRFLKRKKGLKFE